MEQGFIIDTNIAIYLLEARLTPDASLLLKRILKQKAKISIITKIELLSWPENASVFQSFINDSDTFLLEDNVIDECIEIRKKYKTKLPDAIIAATAVVNKLTLVTRNASDFKKIQHLNWINPFDIK